jgi:hypothetical protein
MFPYVQGGTRTVLTRENAGVRELLGGRYGGQRGKNDHARILVPVIHLPHDFKKMLS